MPVIAEENRVTELRRFGVSEALVRLASGDCVHEVFRINCLGPSYYPYHGGGTPAGPPLVPLWDDCDAVVGVWERQEGLEFIEFSIEAGGEYTSLARTEQGFWVSQFNFFYECDVALAELREAAAVVGFRFLDLFLVSREAAEQQLSTFEGYRAWLKNLVANVDREA